MNAADALLEKIITDGLGRCVDKLSRISCGEWRLAGAQMRSGAFDVIAAGDRPDADDGAAVYFEVGGDCPFAIMLIFRAADIAVVSKCLIGSVFPRGACINQLDELMLSELGNIILNSVTGALSGALKRVFMPSVPKLIKGESQFLLEALEATIDRRAGRGLISLNLSLQCDNAVACAEVVGVIPDKLREALEKNASGRD